VRCFDNGRQGSKVLTVSGNRFPSGPWTGFYNYQPRDKHRMDLHLQFAHGKMSGEGNDDVGRFVIKGNYDETGGECTFNKTYIGAHTVSYRGFREGKGIWGTWEISIFGHGGFHIWPLDAGEGEGKSIEAQEPKPVEAELPEAIELPSTTQTA
jgi:hypothetical protein